MPAHDQMPGMSLSRLLPGIGIASHDDVMVSGLCLDSRKTKSGDVFLAVTGQHHDGRQYIGQAIAGGAVAVVVEAEGFVAPQLPTAVPIIPVRGLNTRLSDIAGRFYGEPGKAMNLVGITGTNGKTTCSYLLAQLGAAMGQRAGVVGTLGYGSIVNAKPVLRVTGMTTPDALETQRILADLRADGVELVAMEVSSHSLHQHRVAAVEFAVAVFTNLSRDHLDYHGDFDSYGAAKAALFAHPGLRHAVINIDDPFGQKLAQTIDSAIELITVSTRGQADVRVLNSAFTVNGISAQIETPWGNGELNSSLMGAFNLANLLAVVAAACALGHPLQQVLAELPSLHAAAGRMELIALPGAPRVVVDYAHTPDALENALTALRNHSQGRLWCLFGCGGDRDRGKRNEMGAIASKLADEVVVTSDNPRSEAPMAIISDVLAGIGDTTHVFVEPDRRAAIGHVISRADAEDVILLAGKGHEDYQEVAGQRLPFNDILEAKQALATRAGQAVAQ